MKLCRYYGREKDDGDPSKTGGVYSGTSIHIKVKLHARNNFSILKNVTCCVSINGCLNLGKGEGLGKDLKGKDLGKGLTQRKSDKRYVANYSRRDGTRAMRTFVELKDARQWLNDTKHDDN